MTKAKGLSPSRRWALFAVSAMASGFLFWSPPAKEDFGYFVPLLMSVGLVISNGLLFIASRLERSDVTNLEMRIRHVLFKKIET